MARPWAPAPPHPSLRAQGVAYRDGSLYIASLDPYKSCTLYRLDNVDSYALQRKVSAAAAEAPWGSSRTRA